eukprot:853651-Heterocapsa_arctica.AAC.1
MGTSDTLESSLKELQRATAENIRLGFAGQALYGLNTSSMNPHMLFNHRSWFKGQAVGGL